MSKRPSSVQSWWKLLTNTAPSPPLSAGKGPISLKLLQLLLSLLELGRRVPLYVEASLEVAPSHDHPVHGLLETGANATVLT